MEDATNFMLTTVLACAGGYPEEVLAEYAEVFQKILDNDKLLWGREWDAGRVYDVRRKAKAGE